MYFWFVYNTGVQKLHGKYYLINRSVSDLLQPTQTAAFSHYVTIGTHLSGDSHVKLGHPAFLRPELPPSWKDSLKMSLSSWVTTKASSIILHNHLYRLQVLVSMWFVSEHNFHYTETGLTKFHCTVVWIRHANMTALKTTEELKYIITCCILVNLATFICYL